MAPASRNRLFPLLFGCKAPMMREKSAGYTAAACANTRRPELIYVNHVRPGSLS